MSFNVTPRSIERNLASVMRKAEARIAAFKKKQGEEEVHRLRTSIRRFEATYEILPRQLRKDEALKDCAAILEKLFDSTTPVRDLDTIRRLLNPGLSRADASGLAEVIQIERKRAINKSHKITPGVGKMTRPSLKGVTSKKIQRRFRRVSRRLLDKMREEYPVVIKDPGRVKELHAMRMNCKMLRYTLELLPRSAKAGPVVKDLEGWQNSLGRIRDIDILLSFSESHRIPSSLGAVVASRRDERRQLYREFVSEQAKTRVIQRASDFLDA